MFNRTVKYLLVCGGFVFLLIVFMTGAFISEDAEVKAYNIHLRRLENLRRKREEEKFDRELNKKKPVAAVPEKPVDFGVQFISGKEMVKIVDGEHRAIQMHSVTIENLSEIEALVQCRDSFSKFSSVIKVGEEYTFSVTDIFHKRHYWCTAHFGELHYNFRAYGEGAPRDNNHISLKKEGAFINGKSVRIT